MVRSKLRVKVKSYRRKSYSKNIKTRKGVVKKRIKAVKVKNHKKLMPDRGKLGKTPKAKRWSPKIKEMLLGGQGYVKKPSLQRHKILTGIVNKGPKSGRKSGYATAIRRLNWLRNITSFRKVKTVVKRDMEWLRSKYRK